jgi:N-acylglucosamine 2-epimerase/mannose-6-phosphate isomerase
MDHILVAEIQDWMMEKALPLWTTVGLDHVHGGVVETLSLDATRPGGAEFKRARVACRQLYVFSHAVLLGQKQAAAAADHVYEHLLSRFWQGPDHGWARRVTTEGALLDPTPDLYDHAFALFALAWRFRATQDREALRLAHETLDFLEARFVHPSGEGFHNQLPATLPRQQNPHMHLAEAALALTEASGEQRFAMLSDRMAELFEKHLLRLPQGFAPEFFNDDWTPASEDRGRWVEPGHLFEWAWILAQHQRLRGIDHTTSVKALVAWAERFGVDPSTQVTMNAIRDDGVPLDRGTRTWPNTERLKGWLGLYELTGADPRAAVTGSARLLLSRMLDAYDEAGRPAAAMAPTSTLYHLFLAFAEALRLAPQLLAGRG